MVLCFLSGVRILLSNRPVLFVLPGLVHVGDELREVNGNLITHKRPEEISQILVKHMYYRLMLVQGLQDFWPLTAVMCLFSLSHKDPSL